MLITFTKYNMDTTKKIEEAKTSMERSIAYCNRSKASHSRCYRPLKEIPSWGVVMRLKNKPRMSLGRLVSDIGDRLKIKKGRGTLS